MGKSMIDLHTHSVHSDGTLTPAALIEKAKEQGVTAIALTDHNSILGVPEFLQAAQGSGVEGIAGIEFSTNYEDVELHIIGLFIEPCYFEDITAKMVALKEAKKESNRALVERLNQMGYDISFERLCEAHRDGHINRAHIAKALTEMGYTTSVQDAFARLLDPKLGIYVPPPRPEAYDIIAYIASMGALPVLAHPFLQLSEDRLRVFLPEAVSRGLVAMETEYPMYDEETTLTARRVAEDFGLLRCGGSDYHGANKPYIEMGVGRGDLYVDEDILEKLKQKHKNAQT